MAIPLAKQLALAKYLTYKLNDLTVADLQAIASGLDLGSVTPEIAEQAINLLRSENIDGVADILSRPDLLDKIKGLVVPAKENAIVFQCGHCNNFIKLEFEP